MQNRAKTAEHAHTRSFLFIKTPPTPLIAYNSTTVPKSFFFSIRKIDSLDFRNSPEYAAVFQPQVLFLLKKSAIYYHHDITSGLPLLVCPRNGQANHPNILPQKIFDENYGYLLSLNPEITRRDRPFKHYNIKYFLISCGLLPMSHENLDFPGEYRADFGYRPLKTMAEII